MSGGYFGQSTTPPLRDLNTEIGDIGKAGKGLFKDENAESLQEGQTQLTLAKQYADAGLNYYGQIASGERAVTSAQRNQDSKDIGKYGSSIQSGLSAIDPAWQASLGNLSASEAAGPLLGELNSSAGAGLAKAASLGPSDLRTTLTGQARDELAAGGSLTPEEQMEATQAARAAYSARGLTQSNPAVAAEVLSRDAASQARLQQRQQFAEGVQQIGQSEDLANTQQQVQLGQFGTAVQGANDARTSTLAGATQVAQNALAPTLGFFGQRTDVSPSAGTGILTAAPNTIGAGAQAESPMLSYGSDLFNTNFNAQAATQISNANNLAAIHGAIIGAVGSMAGGAAGRCWVAREILGTLDRDERGRLKWETFRAWLDERAPRWFARLYVAHGERAAKWFKRHPLVKIALRPFFELIVHRQSRS